MTNTILGDDVEVIPHFGAFILETLTIGMYAESRNAIREYVQNSFDAIVSARAEGLLLEDAGTITVTLADEEVIIRDDGIGMPSVNAVSHLTSIGASQKDFRKQAGFRGIGRLSGMVMCDSLIFKTKAHGETIETEVTFDCKEIRSKIEPARSLRWPLDKLIKQCVTAKRYSSRPLNSHYFEVKLKGLHEPPEECVDINKMASFLSEIGPVGYSSDFEYEKAVLGKGLELGKPIESATILLKSGDEAWDIRKPYGKNFQVGKGFSELSGIEFPKSDAELWWGWIGRTTVPGSYSGDGSGIRVRARNIQIDGTQLMRELFSKVEDASSYTRFNEWYVGEIFINHDELVPNARRDGFEETLSWIKARGELIALCKKLGADAYDLSNTAQTSPGKVLESIRKIEEKKAATLNKAVVDVDQAIIFFKDVEKAQRKVSKAIRYAGDLEVAAKLRSYETRLLKARSEVLARTSGSSAPIDIIRAVRDAEQQMLERIVVELTKKLDGGTCSKVMEILEGLYGEKIYGRTTNE